MLIKMLNSVETTKSNYQRLLAKLKKHPHFIFKLPKLKLVIGTISSGKNEESIYQGNKHMNYSKEKRYLEDHAAYIVQTIVYCFERLYCNLFGGEEKYEINENSLSNYLTLSFIYICALIHLTFLLYKIDLKLQNIKCLFSVCL